MWYAVETAFIKGKQYKSRLMFDKNLDENDNRRVQPGTCLCGHEEEPHNSCQTFMDGEIEIHVDWFQTKEQAVIFANGGGTYQIHREYWYETGIRTVRSRFLKWEFVPANGDILPFRGVTKQHYKYGQESITNALLKELLNAEDNSTRDAAYRGLAIIGIDKEAVDAAASKMKEEQS